jgi:hypothetical protein
VCRMVATQRLVVPVSTMTSPSRCARTKRAEDGGTTRMFAWRVSTVLFALACVALATWTAYFLWEVISADALPRQADLTELTPGFEDGTLETWLESHFLPLGAEENDGFGVTPYTASVLRPRDVGVQVSRKPKLPRTSTDTRTLKPLAGANLQSLPWYAYRDALADRTSSNINDVAQLAAEDRRQLEYLLKTGSFSATGGVSAETKKRGGASTENSKLPIKRVVATHHKTGTALMHDIFSTIISGGDASNDEVLKALQKRNAQKWNDLYGAFVDFRDLEDHPERFEQKDFASANDAGVFLDYHFGKVVPEFIGRVNDLQSRERVGLPELLCSEGSSDGSSSASSSSESSSTETSARYRMVHVVRDPVDVLVSGYLYHRRLPLDEGWLHKPAPNMAGKSYRDLIKNTTPLTAMEAEISMADDELRTMVLAFRDAERDPDALNLKLEDFRDNFDETVRRVLRHLQFAEPDIQDMMELAKEFDTKRWSTEELGKNEHFTRLENRTPFKRAIANDPFLNETCAYLRYALGYTETFPEFKGE